jgi:hypothetical protein
VPEPPEDAEADVTVTVSDALGSFVRCVACPVAVSFTDVTDVAVAATAIFACSSVDAPADSVPMLHEDPPSPLAQPTVNSAFSVLGAAARSTTTAVAPVPFSAETLTM